MTGGFTGRLEAFANVLRGYIPDHEVDELEADE